VVGGGFGVGWCVYCGCGCGGVWGTKVKLRFAYYISYASCGPLLYAETFITKKKE